MTDTSLVSPCAGLVIQHMLVPLDGSPLAERAIPYVAAVAKGSPARVTLLRVLEPASGGSMPTDVLDWEIARREAAAYLAKIQADLGAAGVVATAEVVQGKASEQVLHFAAAAEVDLVVLTSHGEGGVAQWTLSSTSNKVAMTAPTSVLIVPTRASNREVAADLRLHKIMVALDCSPRAECILPTATKLAREHGAELILAHVVPEPELPRRLSPSAQDLDLAQQLIERNQREALRYLRELQSRLGGPRAHVQVRTTVSARSAQALQDLAQHEAVDLIMVSAHGLSGDAGTAYGSVSRRLLQDTDRPVMVVQDFAASGREPRPIETSPQNFRER